MEYSPELFSQVSGILGDYRGLLEKGEIVKSFNLVDCQAIFAKKQIDVLGSGKLDFHKNTPRDTSFAQYTSISYKGLIVNILNVHGKSKPGHKKDTSARIKQSQKMIDFMKDKKGPKIIGGDFNLLPDTKSVNMIEKAGYSNLIKEFNIKTTRNKITWEQSKNHTGFIKQYFADYVFVSPEIHVKSFEVPYIEISDHLPMILDFDI
jgi:endonuclease/exonuclease/phosphatase family metal-dependent hydrolase